MAVGDLGGTAGHWGRAADDAAVAGRRPVSPAGVGADLSAGVPAERYRMKEPPMSPEQLPADWRKALHDEFRKPYFKDLTAFVNEQRDNHTVFPPEADVFSAFKATPFSKVKVLLLGQDPYHG